MENINLVKLILEKSTDQNIKKEIRDEIVSDKYYQGVYKLYFVSARFRQFIDTQKILYYPEFLYRVLDDMGYMYYNNFWIDKKLIKQIPLPDVTIEIKKGSNIATLPHEVGVRTSC